MFGLDAFRADLPELPELDNLFAPEGAIAAAQALAAQAFGAERTWFLANGSTCGIEAAVLATCGPGDKIILPRNVHSSAISGLILSGAVPVYIHPGYSSTWDIAIGVKPSAIEVALAQHPDAKAVLLVSPTYYGICSDLAAIAHLTHTHNIPLLVDEAHGPHFTFHPDLPPAALSAGADIAIQSTHKVLSAFTQAAMLHMRGDRVDRDRLSQCLQLTQSTSPSYLLLASLDAARQQMATAGFSLMGRTLALADRAAQALSELPGLRVLQPNIREGGRGKRGDRTRLTVDVSGLGLTGFQADEILHTQCGVTAELPDLHHIMFIISLGNTADDIAQLIEGFHQLCALYSAKAGREFRTARMAIQPELSVKKDRTEPRPSQSPRQVFFARKKPIATAQSLGHICAETICPYPPGIPILFPGEPITAAALTYLQTVQKAGGVITGCQDPNLKTILIAADEPTPP